MSGSGSGSTCCAVKSDPEEPDLFTSLVMDLDLEMEVEVEEFQEFPKESGAWGMSSNFQMMIHSTVCYVIVMLCP